MAAYLHSIACRPRPLVATVTTCSTAYSKGSWFLTNRVGDVIFPSVVDEYYVSLGRGLREARTDANLTQAAVASRLGVSRVTVANIEAGRQRLAVHQLVAYADIVDAEIHRLLPPRDVGGSGDLRRRAKAQSWSEETQAMMARVWTRIDRKTKQ